MAEVTVHTCPALGCMVEVPLDLLACKAHWFTLPKALRREITEAWKVGELARWAACRQTALDLLTKPQGDPAGGALVDHP